jgi:hypothetical protein
MQKQLLICIATILVTISGVYGTLGADTVVNFNFAGMLAGMCSTYVLFSNYVINKLT